MQTTLSLDVKASHHVDFPARHLCKPLKPRAVLSPLARTQRCYLHPRRGTCPSGRRRQIVNANSEEEVEPNKAILDAFFMGRAFAEVLSERMGSAIGEVLSEVAKQDAENRRSFREFENEVTKRATDSKTKSTRLKAEKARTEASSSESSVQDEIVVTDGSEGEEK